MPRVARIDLYPLKSFDGQSVEQARLLPGAGLEHDRRFAIVDLDGTFVNAKRTAAVHRVASSIDPTARVLILGLRGSSQNQRFHLDADRSRLEAWLSAHFELRVKLVENSQNGFPDDLEAPGPTVISRATLETVAEWFAPMTLDEVRARFRANIEIDGVEPFWEDRLYGPAERPVEFWQGTARLAGTNPCQRCVVPSRSPWTGEAIAGFAKQFAERRAAALPDWAERSRFNHFFRLAVNTRTLEPATIRVGDEIRLAGAG